MISKLILQIRLTTVFALLLVSLKSYCQDTEGYIADTVVYTTQDDKDHIQIRNIQGKWCFENEVVIIEDSLWISSNSEIRFKLAIHSLTSDIDELIMIHLCNRCISYTWKDNIPNDEILIYKVLKYNHNELKIENFMTHEIKDFIRCEDW